MFLFQRWRVLRLLGAHGEIPPVPPHPAPAHRYCEDQLLEVAVRYGLIPPPSARLPLEAMLASHLQKVGGFEGGFGGWIRAGPLPS